MFFCYGKVCAYKKDTLMLSIQRLLMALSLSLKIILHPKSILLSIKHSPLLAVKIIVVCSLLLHGEQLLWSP